MDTDIWPENTGASSPDPRKIVDYLTGELAALRDQIGTNPQLNPTALLAYKLSVRFEKGSMGINDFRQLARILTDRAFARRALHIRDYLGVAGDADAMNKLGQVADSWFDETEGDFDEFRSLVSRPRVGAVFTAHPTFGMSAEAALIMADIAATADEDQAIPMAEERLKGISHALADDITLGEEHARAQQAATRLKDALGLFNAALIERARKRWPDRWRELLPQPMSVAGWVGYDLDGRTDIGWQQMVGLKLAEKIEQLRRYRTRLSAIEADPNAADVTDDLGAAGALLDGALAHSERCHAMFAAELDTVSPVAEAANALSDPDADGRMINCRELVERLTTAIDRTVSDAVAESLMVLRAEVELIGLGTAHIHLRINAMQLQNGINQLIKLDDSESGAGRLQMSRLNRMIAEADLRTVNIRSLMLEQSTAIRQFILMAQILKHIDADTPIRFLIAECEHPFTVMTALYFARLFGIEDKIDISPLFETPAAIESGARILEQLLDNERYMAYANGRGRIAVQTGFSDAGRFLGQIPATLGIERLQVKLARMLGARGIEGIEIVIFDTHGESIGRGAHPKSLRDRLLYVMSPMARRQYARAGVALKHETSFQGGDGYLLFANDQLARHTAFTVLADALSIDDADADAMGRAHHVERDSLYDDTDFTLDFFLRLAHYHEGLFADHDYRVTLGSFGTNLLFKTGSRKSIRQHDTVNLADRGNPAQMRAIPHNAILQQLGYLANVVSGIGSAVGDEVDRFVSLCENSDRARRLFSMVAIAKQTSSLNTLGAYARIFDQGYWVSRAYGGAEPVLERPIRRLAKYLSDDPRHEAMMRLVHRLRQDAIDLHGVLGRLHVDGGKVPAATRLELDLLHALRIALIEHIFILAARIPPFANRHDVSPERISGMIMAMEIPDAVRILRDVFPSKINEPGDAMFIEEASYQSDVAGGYHDLHEKLFDPMLAAYDLVREIGIGVSHHFFAHG